MNATTKISKTQDGEYRVRLFIDGEYQAGADCFETDLKAAKGSARMMEEKAHFSDKTAPEAISEQAVYDEENGGN